jgi:hypothetical protein
MNPKRKRTPGEQKAYDEIERFKQTLKDEKALRDVRRDRVLAASPTADIYPLFALFTDARDRVTAMEGTLRELELSYKRLREGSDA